MKNPLSPAVIAVVAVVLVVILAYFGWRTFKPGGSGSNSNPYTTAPSGAGHHGPPASVGAPAPGR